MIRQRTEFLYGTGEASAAGPSNRQTAAGASLPSDSEILGQPSLDAYLRYGLHENGALRSAYEHWRAALEAIPQVSSLPDPIFGFEQFIEQIQTRTGPQLRRYSLSQTFPWFGKLALRGDVASGEAEELWQAVVAERLRVEEKVTVSYFEYGYLAQSIRITEGVLDLLRQLEPVIQRRIAGGISGQEDLLRLQVEIGRIENDLASLGKVRPARSAGLAAAMNWQSQQVLPLPELTEPVLSRVEVESLIQRAEELNPELKGLSERIAKNNDALELASLEKWPDFTVGVDYFETGSAVAPVAGSGDDPWGIRFSMTLPMWRSRYAAAEREARRNISAASYALTDRRATLRSDLELAAFEMDDAGRQVVLFRETLLPRAREALEVTRAAYRAGTSSLLDIIDSERALLDFEIGYWRACRDHYQSEARLEALVGGSL